MTDNMETYLGDSVYASVDASSTIIIATGSQAEIASSSHNYSVIYLDPSVMAALIEFKDRAYRRLQERQPNEQ